MNELEDIKLKVLLQSMELEKPTSDFSTRVMKQIFEENNALEQIKAQRILGKGFWLIVAVFVAMTVVFYLMYQQGGQPESQIEQLVPGVEQGINSMLGKLGSVPLSIAGILIASSVLLFIDRIIGANAKLFSH